MQASHPKGIVKKRLSTECFQRPVQWNYYYFSYALTFYREYKTINVLKNEKIKPNTSIIYHFIINTNKWYGHPPLSPLSSMTFDNVEFYYVWQRHCFIIKLNLTLNTIHFLAQYTGVNYRLKQSCLHLTNCWFNR